MKQIEYSYLRAEKNHDIVVFIKVEPEWLDKDIYFGIEDNKFAIRLPNDEMYVSKEIDSMLKARINTKATPIVFTDNLGNFLSEMNLEPQSKNKVKP